MSQNIPLPSEGAQSGNGRATATCYCSAIQMEFPTEGDGLVDTFLCNCTDCRKITASMFASNFVAKDDSVKFIRGEDLLSKYAHNKSTASGKEMANYFCSKCGTLMYRVGEAFPAVKIMRIGTVDDFSLHDTKLKPRVEIYGKDRVSWLPGAQGVKQHEGGNL